MRSRFAEQELRVEAERYVKYKGTARIRLEVLHFQWGEPRELSQKNVERLKEAFRTDNIRRLEPGNHIPAVVTQSDLDDAIQASGTSAGELLSHPDNDPPVLRFPAGYLLTCLHGRHRVQAARETLPPIDAWWTVDLYLADTNPELRTILVEEYSNEEKPSDGEIYRKIRQYEQERNLCFKNRWKARLSNHGRRGLSRLEDHDDLTAAFDDLLVIPGLWDGMRIGTLHKTTGMKCDEEVLHYLEHIKKVWSKLLHGDEMALQRVDQATVRALELKAPRHSKRDARVLQGQLLSGQIFGAFSQQEREAIWNELKSVDCLIPSLFTFFEDLKYLSACADCLKRLVKLSRKESVSSALEQKFADVNQISGQCILEIAESTFAVRPGRTVDRLDWGKRQLWLSAMRHYRDMPPDPKKKNKDLLAKAGCYGADETVLHEYAALADRLGFASREIDSLNKRSSDREIACNALLKARKPDRYEYGDAVLEAHVNEIVRMFMTASPLPSESLSPALVSDNPQASGNRCGFPDKDAHEHDGKFLFITHLHDESEEQGEEITSFFVRRSVYFAFFGKSVDLEGGPSLKRPPPPNEFSSPPEIEMIERGQTLEREGLQRQEMGGLGQEQERIERGRIKQEKERLKQERLKLKQEKLRQKRREQEWLKQNQKRLQRERHKQEALNRYRHKRERLRQERLKLESLKLEKLEQEKLGQKRREQEWVERETHKEKTLDRDRHKRERLRQERLKLESLKLERLGREKLEQEKPEERPEPVEREEQEQPDQERGDSERVQKRHTQINMERVICATGNQDSPPGATQADRGAQAEDYQAGQGTLESVTAGTGSSTPPNPQTPVNSPHNFSSRSLLQDSASLEIPRYIRITFKVREQGIWRVSDSLDVDPSDPSEVQRVAVRYMRRHIRLFDNKLNILAPRDCFEAAIVNGSNTILLIPEEEIDISEELESSIL